MNGADHDELGRLVGRALEEVGWDVEAAAERLMRVLDDGARCILALERLADLAEEARRLTNGPEQAENLLRLRVCYRQGIERA